MKLKLALLTAAGSFAVISGASAQDNTGYYGQLGGGVVLSNDSNDIESADSTPAAFDSEFDLDTNISLYGALGRYFNNGIRGDIELATRTQEIESLPGDGLGFAGFPNNNQNLGDLSVTTLMVNVYKDLDVGLFGDLDLEPYVGAGVGVARVRPEFDNTAFGSIATTVADMANSNIIAVGDTDYVPAIQGMAGMTFDFTESMMLDLRYRYLRTAEYDYGGFVNGPIADLSGEYTAHEVLAAVRWNWGAPAVVPVQPAPQPVTFQTCFDGSRIPVTEICPPAVEEEMMMEMDPLVVYFDYDKSTLSTAAQTLIAARAEEALDGNVQSVSVQGNTDSAGSASYNQALSARRGAVVRDALIANGISSNIISVDALGESNPARASGDGVREPLNRRTEVLFSF